MIPVAIIIMNTPDVNNQPFTVDPSVANLLPIALMTTDPMMETTIARPIHPIIVNVMHHISVSNGSGGVNNPITVM